MQSHSWQHRSLSLPKEGGKRRDEERQSEKEHIVFFPPRLAPRVRVNMQTVCIDVPLARGQTRVAPYLLHMYGGLVNVCVTSFRPARILLCLGVCACVCERKDRNRCQPPGPRRASPLVGSLLGSLVMSGAASDTLLLLGND